MGTSKLSKCAEARRMACGFRAGFLEEVAFEPALMDWVRQSCGQDSLSRGNSLGKGLEGMRTRWMPGEQRSTSVPPPDPPGTHQETCPHPLPFWALS